MVYRKSGFQKILKKLSKVKYVRPDPMPFLERSGETAENHRNFPVIFPPDSAENEMESYRQKSNDFQTGNVSLEKAGYDRFR